MKVVLCLLGVLTLTIGFQNGGLTKVRRATCPIMRGNRLCVGRSLLRSTSLNMSTSPNRKSLRTTSFIPNLVIMFLLLPLSAELFPFLLGRVTDFQIEPIERQRFILELLLLKRVFIYSAAITGVDWMAKRSLSDSGESGLGERLAGLNEEMLDFSLEQEKEGVAKSPVNLGSDFNEQAAPLLAQLDDMGGQEKALALPVLVALSLLASFAGLQLSQQANAWLQMQAAQSEAASQQVLDPVAIQVLSQSFSAVATVGVCTLFSKAEIQRLLLDAEENSDGGMAVRNIGGNATNIALVFSVVAVLNPVLTKLIPPSPYWQGNGLWPLSNIVNLLVGATISRAFQLPTLPIVLTALGALVAYDVFFVLGTQALTDGGQSIMEAVAMAKLQATSSAVSGAAASVASSVGDGASSAAAATSLLPSPQSQPAAPAAAEAMMGAIGSHWRPGLLQVSLNGKVSDALGLGDVIFPSLLAGWALRYDNRSRDSGSASGDDEDDSGRQVYPSALGGYALGCLLCELFQTGAGQPALLYVVPAMVGVMATLNLDLLLDETRRGELLGFEG